MQHMTESVNLLHDIPKIDIWERVYYYCPSADGTTFSYSSVIFNWLMDYSYWMLQQLELWKF